MAVASLGGGRRLLACWPGILARRAGALLLACVRAHPLTCLGLGGPANRKLSADLSLPCMSQASCSLAPPMPATPTMRPSSNCWPLPPPRPTVAPARAGASRCAPPAPAACVWQQMMWPRCGCCAVLYCSCTACVACCLLHCSGRYMLLGGAGQVTKDAAALQPA